jgi:hypothetical protein
MYRKGKSHEINDIIDSADAIADYSHTNKYYEEVYSNKIYNKNDNTTVPETPTNTNTFTNNTFTNNRFTNNRFRQNNDNTSTAASTNNIFLKASSQTNLFSSSSNSTKNEPSKEQTLSLDNDNFPSLGSTKKTNNVSNVAKTLDFKKVVQTKSNVVHTTTTPIPSLHKQVNHSKKLSIFQEIRDQSEKYAKVKMYNEFSSDDDGY